MKKYYNFLRYLILFNDIFFFYISLTLLVLTRYGFSLIDIKNHFFGFTFLLPFWIIIFYSQDFYSLNLIKNKFSLRVIKSFIFGFFISIIIFYFIPYFKIQPKTNLFIFIFLYMSLFLISRLFLEENLIKKNKLKILVFIPDYLKNKFLDDFRGLDFYEFYLVNNNEIPYEKDFYLDFNAIVLSRKIINEDIISSLVKKTNFQIPIIELVDFYEKNLGRIPLEEIDEYWILKEIINPEHKFFSITKRFFDIIFSLFIGIISLPLIPLISLCIYLNSPGPIIFKQKRVGINNKEFFIYKFRTMKLEKQDPGIWEKHNDERIFFCGRILRKLHLDEIPQIINVLKGNLSFVGPRPEQVNIVEELKIKIPYYNFRHLVLPGITGWSQVNYKKPFNLEETKIKLEYDFYYLKNRNLLLDLIIFLKTIFNI
jgi:lipopolysaccharide/colanic/teichoic acid biosynthesis glycosyltransferase